jgi:hypothetical protein
MPDHRVIRFPAGRVASPVYSDTAALNDIHAILCRGGGWDPATLACRLTCLAAACAVCGSCGDVSGVSPGVNAAFA